MGEYSTREYIILAVVVFVIVALVIGLLVGLGLNKPQATTTNISGTTGINGNPAVVELVVIDGKVIHKPVDDFKSFINSTDEPVFVDFWAAWCGPCTAAAPFVEQLAIQYDGKAHILKVDVDQADDLTRKYQVSSIPLFLVFANGQVKDSMIGYAASIEDRIRKMLNDQVTP